MTRFVVANGNLEDAIRKWQQLGAEHRRSIKARSYFVGPAEARRIKQRRAADKTARRAYVKAKRRAA
jgi:ribosomal protein S21